MKFITIIVALLAVAGCASQPGGFDPSKLSPEQLSALAKDRSAIGQCATAKGLYGSGVVVWVQLDKATFPAGGAVTVNDTCSMVFTQAVPGSKP